MVRTNDRANFLNIYSIYEKKSVPKNVGTRLEETV